ADFTANLLSGGPISLEVVSQNAAPNTRAALAGFARGVASRLSDAQTAIRAIIELNLRDGRGVPEIDPQTLGLFGADQLIIFETEQVGDIEPFNASNFTLPGYLTMFVFFAAAMAAESIARERETQTLERLMSNGVRRESIILGKYLSAAYRGLLQLAVLWIVGIFAFRIDLGAAPVAVILVSVFMVIASSGFGIMLASFVKTQRSAASAGVLTSLILAPIGGCWWPLFITPDWMQSLARLTPHCWANTAFNNLMLFGAEFDDVLANMAALIAFAVAFIAIALLRFRLSAAG
ncbi:MAG: ABC transporter permease, partial [Ardenticatenaceae bacterium]